MRRKSSEALSTSGAISPVDGSFYPCESIFVQEIAFGSTMSALSWLEARMPSFLGGSVLLRPGGNGCTGKG